MLSWPFLAARQVNSSFDPLIERLLLGALLRRLLLLLQLVIDGTIASPSSPWSAIPTAAPSHGPFVP